VFLKNQVSLITKNPLPEKKYPKKFFTVYFFWNIAKTTKIFPYKLKKNKNKNYTTFHTKTIKL
jgi:hypothetical protein